MSLSPRAALLVASLVSTPLLAQEQQPKFRMPGLDSLTVNGEYRLRYENRYNYDLQDNAGDDDDFVTQRARLQFDAAVNQDLGFVLQLQDVRKWGEETATTDPSADGLDVHRAYMRWKGTPLGGDAKLGRQVLAFGDQRLIGGLEWLSQGRAFDGVRHTWQQEDSYTLDAFITQVRELAPSAVYDDELFLGVYCTLDSVDDMEFDAYLLHLNDEETVAGGNENRTTLGLRWEQKFGSHELGAEAALQFGEVDGADIDFGDAYALHAHWTWNFAGPLKPWFKLEGNYATGNDPATAENERFKNLFPTAHAHWGMMDFALWENTVHYSAEIGVLPHARGKLSLSYHSFESVEEADAFRGPVAQVAPAGAAPGSSNDIGDEIDLFYNYEFDTAPARTWVQVGYGVFLPGSGARAVVGDDDPAHFLYLMTGVQF